MASIESHSGMISKTCPRCGAGFECGQNAVTDTTNGATCWCQDLPPIMPLDTISDCLCPVCLKAEIDARLGSPAA